MVAAHAAGRAVEILWTTRSVRRMCNDRWFRRWVLWTELAIVASLGGLKLIERDHAGAKTHSDQLMAPADSQHR